MSALTLAAKMYKDVFRGGRPAMLAMRNKPGISRARKADDLTGTKSIFPIRTHLHAGASHTFTDAQDNDTSNDIYRWELTAKDHYAIVKWPAKELAFSRDNVGAYLERKAKDTEEVLEYAGQRMEKEFWQGTTLGQPTGAPTNVSGSTYRATMATDEGINNIHVGQVIECWTTATGSGTQRAEEAVVTAINHSARTWDGTFTGNPSTWANTDYLFVEGDRDANGVFGWTSIDDYIPSSDPSSTTFQGLDRTKMMNYLSGWRLSSTYGTLEETCQQLCVKMGQYVNAIKGKSEFWMHPRAFQVLQSEAGARLVREQGVTAELGYTKCAIASAMGNIPVMVGAFVKQGRMYLLDWSTITIHTNKPLFHVINEDGVNMLRKESEDAFEMRWRSWSEVLVDEPVKCGTAASGL